MRNSKSVRLALLCAACLASTVHASTLVRHRMVIELEASTNTLTVVDHVTLPGDGPHDFLLNAALTVENAERIPLGDVEAFFGINSSGASEGLELARYRVEAASGEIALRYQGTMDFGLSDQKEEYTRGFRETFGQVSEEGVFLAGSSFWYPYFNDDLVEFELEATLPAGWHVISQGDGTSRGEDGRARWNSGPMDEIYLVGGPLEVYRDAAGAVETLVYLHERDDALAAKYLSTTAQYLEMYRGLLGPYPYGKFALVENFWETGYGMPSFTLLGPRVIRFPFILHSSYPHEILHNWWGNSVFVDYDSGNWCEGLTAYLADHLVQEQRGKGAEHRRGVLRKYRDYVKDGRDFPLREFRSRHSAATEAVGYGKTLMGFHMLRGRLGDEDFVRALQRFLRAFSGRRASFADLRASFEEASGEDLGTFFDEWVGRPGAAALEVAVSGVRLDDGGFVVEGHLEQIQDDEPFTLDVPVMVQTEAGVETATVRLEGASQPLSIRTREKPLALHVDPLFEVFRLLDPRETPPSIGQLFGEPEIVALLPSAAGEGEVLAYRELMDAWQSDSHAIDVRLDTEVASLPDDRAVWILGRGNRWAEQLFEPDVDLGVDMDDEKVVVQREEIPFADHSVVWIRRHPSNLEKAAGWLVVEPEAAFLGLARKLPHYGKYSYLGFEGEEPTNTVKGQWPSADSPLRIDLRAERAKPLPAPALEKREALAELPPVFSQKTLMEHVAYLAAPELEGRGVGSAGLARASDYIARQFEAAGLEPGGDDGTYYQKLTVPGPDGILHNASNIIGYLPGGREAWRGQSALVTAHYDHLGRGWPDVRQGNEGQVHPGADDNASGVAVLIELAKTVASGEKPGRNLVFAAFTSEEAGRAGSRHYAEHPAFPLDKLMGIVNLDTVGRLHDQKVSVLGTGTAEEWQHIFRGSSFVTGVESRNIPGSAEGSDQWSFIEKGVPGVQIFTKAHEDYHRPGDTADKVDGAGLVKIATFVKEAVVYLGEREEPLTVTIAGAAPQDEPTATPRPGRRVSFGTVPEFAFQGPGVKLAGVTLGSPAEKAGLQEGDVLLAIDGTEIADLRVFSSLLRSLTPGQTVVATVRRGEQEFVVEVTVVAR